MPYSLADPEHTAVLVMEMQRGVVGDLATMRALADAVASENTVSSIARLLGVARSKAVRIVYCTAEWRADRAGTILTTPILSRLAGNPAHILQGTTAVDVIPELAPQENDLVSARLHGLTPFNGTSLDTWLRSLGIATIIATGVSVNIGIVGMCIEATNMGYHVVVPTDAVCGIPASYAADVLTNTIAMLGHLTTVDAIIDAWS